MNAEDFRVQVASLAPVLWSEVTSIASQWTEGIELSLNHRSGREIAFPKTFTDPVLGPVELYEWEFILLDSPLLQRLRGIRQLGMVHMYFHRVSLSM